MGMVLLPLESIVGIASLVCLIMVIVKMFQVGQTGLGVVCIVTSLCGIGWLITFIVGWINVEKWGIRNLMLIWTACWIGGIVLSALGAMFGTPLFSLPTGR